MIDNCQNCHLISYLQENENCEYCNLVNFYYYLIFKTLISLVFIFIIMNRY